jgi:hypothetical protein
LGRFLPKEAVLKDKEGIIQKLWTGHMSQRWTGRRWIADKDDEIPAVIIQIDRLVEDIARSTGDLFYVVHGRTGVEAVHMHRLGERMVDCARQLDLDRVRFYLSRHRFSPHFELWEKHKEEFAEISWYAQSPEHVHALNQWVDTLRREARESAFRNLVAQQERAARKNWVNLRAFLNTLFRRHSKLLVVRVDVGYRHDLEDIDTPCSPPSDKDAKGDLTQMIRFIRRKLPALVGYVWKLEYGSAKGHHCHLMLLMDGHQVREDVSWGRIVGEKWKEISQEKGSYWNCNADKERYRRRGLLGIGLVHYTDRNTRANLERAALYLAKVDFYCRFISRDMRRTFGKSVIKARAHQRGRPRTQAAGITDDEL